MRRPLRARLPVRAARAGRARRRRPAADLRRRSGMLPASVCRACWPPRSWRAVARRPRGPLRPGSTSNGLLPDQAALAGWRIADGPVGTRRRTSTRSSTGAPSATSATASSGCSSSLSARGRGGSQRDAGPVRHGQRAGGVRDLQQRALARRALRAMGSRRIPVGDDRGRLERPVLRPRRGGRGAARAARDGRAPGA